MTSEIEKYLALLEKRLSLLRMLAQQLVDCRKEFVSMDLEGMYSRIAEQEDLCRQIQSLEPAIGALQRTCARQLEQEPQNMNSISEYAAWSERLRTVMVELGESQEQVGRLNLIHAAYLRRSRKTVQVLINFFGNYALTYARPVGPMLAAPRTMEKV